MILGSATMDGQLPRSGFSLIEVFVALAIIAIACAMGAPSFRNSLLDARRAAAVNEFMHSLYKARSDSLLKAEFVALCPSRTLERCDSSPPRWQEGWIAFVNRDHDVAAAVDTGEEILERHPALPGIEVAANRNSLVFRNDSFTGTTASFVFCDERGGRFARAVIVSQTGRPRLSESDAYGQPLKCN
jgi:type IV fimbrial biogenesis protein FimT